MIVLEHISKTYDTGQVAVCDVSLRVPAGKMLVLLGGSGCGKTTTLKMINRLVEPTAGRIEVDGRDVRGVDPVQLRRAIGYVVQGSALFPHLTVAENIAVVPRLLNWPAPRIEQRVDELLRLGRRWVDAPQSGSALPPPSHHHEPHPRPALAEVQVLEVGPDLVACWLDGLDDPALGEGVVQFLLRQPPGPLRPGSSSLKQIRSSRPPGLRTHASPST
jgi:hypothetical protein